MKTKPILFSTSMVQAILNGTKTQTRRLQGLKKYNTNPNSWRYDGQAVYDNQVPFYNHYMEKLDWDYEPTEQYDIVKCKIKKGDILWVRETFEKVPIEKASVLSDESKVEYNYTYKADKLDSFKAWKPSIFMPKEACRLFLEVTDVYVERLQDISVADSRDEGIKDVRKEYGYDFEIFEDYLGQMEFWAQPKYSFISLWISINGKDSWNANPWVWVYRFKQCERPENFPTFNLQLSN